MEHFEGSDPYAQNSESDPDVNGGQAPPTIKWYGNAKAPSESGVDSRLNITEPEAQALEPENDYDRSFPDESLAIPEPKKKPKPAVAGRFSGLIDTSEHPLPPQESLQFSTNDLLDAINNFNEETSPGSNG